MRDLPRQSRVLDIACGEGDLAHYLTRRGCKVWAADICESVMRKGMARYCNPRLAFVAADANMLPFASGAFDWLLSFDTLELIPDDSRVAAEFARVVKPGGILLLSIPVRAPNAGDLFFEQRALRRWLPRVMYSNSRAPQSGHSWFESDADDIVCYRCYPLEQVRAQFSQFELVDHDYAVKRFSALMMDVAYGVRGFPRLGLKPLLLWLGSRLDALFCAGPKHPGYTLLAKLRRKS